MTLSNSSRGRHPRTVLPCAEWLEDRSLLSLTGLLTSLPLVSPPTSIISQPALVRIMPADALNGLMNGQAGHALRQDLRLAGDALESLVKRVGGVSNGIVSPAGLLNLTADLTTSLGQAAQRLQPLVTVGSGGFGLRLGGVELNVQAPHAANDLLGIVDQASQGPRTDAPGADARQPRANGIGNLDPGLAAQPIESRAILGGPDIPGNDPMLAAIPDNPAARIYEVADPLSIPSEDDSPEAALSPGQAAESVRFEGTDFEAAWRHILNQLNDLEASGPIWHWLVHVAPWLLGVWVIGAAFETARRRQQYTLRGLALNGICGVALGNCFPEMGGLSLRE